MGLYQFTDEQRALLEGMQVPFAIYQFFNKRVHTLVLTDGFCKLFGYGDFASAYYDMDNDMYKDVHRDDVARIANDAVVFATKGGHYETVYRAWRKEISKYIIIHAKGEHVITETGEQLAHIWYTEEGVYEGASALDGYEVPLTLSDALREQSIVKESRYDYLTGLPSMTYFFELVEAEKEGIREKGGWPVLLYMDFCGMKFFNARLGFEQGDKMLQAFAKLLAREFSNESCCRIGADHFAVITEEASLEDKLHRIFRDLGKLYEGQTPPVHVGIYPYRLEEVAASAACDRAILACKEIKEMYASDFCYFKQQMNADAVLRQYIIENINIAIRERWIQVFYQPIVRAVNEKVCDEEALARWIDPVYGFLPPDTFIPVLEETGLVYKLDLCILEQVLEDMRTMQKEGLYVVAHSINLSRSDFFACDIVEEIRRRVDESGICRDRITIEITESTIGEDFDFMKEQIARFQNLGFQVWMDDFGSGYSSLNVLQRVRFDLLKFDMSFMRKLDEGESGKVILTELMKMAAALGVETICEGVEKEEQVRFLQEIGCSKMQGYYFKKPSPFRIRLEWYKNHRESILENPAEAGYYEAIGRVNLSDLNVIAQGDEIGLKNTFDSFPMGILEVQGETARFVRSNLAYREFVKRYYGLDLPHLGPRFVKYDNKFMHDVVKTCCEQGQRSLYDERMPDGSIVHSFARRISVNPVTGSMAVAIAVLSIVEPGEGMEAYLEQKRHLERLEKERDAMVRVMALSEGYMSIFTIDPKTGAYIEYSSTDAFDSLGTPREGEDFFKQSDIDIQTVLHPDDRQAFAEKFTKENVLREIREKGSFSIQYRLLLDGKPVPVTLRAALFRDGTEEKMVVGVRQ